eukprot:g4531.t1
MGKRPWKNPAESGDVEVIGPSNSPAAVLQAIVGLISESKDLKKDLSLPSKFFGVDCKSYRIAPTAYLYKNGGGRGLVVRSWSFEGKVDEASPWETLDTRHKVSEYSSDGSGYLAAVWELPSTTEPPKFYRKFRFVREDSTTIYVHRFEVYGQLKRVGV